MIYLFRWFLCSFTAGVVVAELWLMPIFGTSLHQKLAHWWAYGLVYPLPGAEVMLAAAKAGAVAGLLGVMLGALLYLRRVVVERR